MQYISTKEHLQARRKVGGNDNMYKVIKGRGFCFDLGRKLGGPMAIPTPPVPLALLIDKHVEISIT